MIDFANTNNRGGGTYTETDPTVADWAKAPSKPTYTASEVGAQPALVSGENIKTVNGNSLLGAGNIEIQAGAASGGGVIDSLGYGATEDELGLLEEGPCTVLAFGGRLADDLTAAIASAGGSFANQYPVLAWRKAGSDLVFLQAAGADDEGPWSAIVDFSAGALVEAYVPVAGSALAENARTYVEGDGVVAIKPCTQDEYDDMPVHKANTIYIITAASQRAVGVNPHPFTLAGKTVFFTESNLMYDGTQAANKWRLHENPWDRVNSANGTVAMSADAKIDLFGWATSGYKGTTWLKDNGYDDDSNFNNPWMTSLDNHAYGPDMSDVDWTADSEEWDWAKNNRICNFEGKMLQAASKLRVPTKDEWSAVLSTARSTADIALAHAKATVNGVPGLIIFSDDYVHPAGITALVSANSGNAAYNANDFSAVEWARMASAGAVFLPCAGYRYREGLNQHGSYGDYWSSTAPTKEHGTELSFKADRVAVGTSDRYYGCSVRLIQDA